MAVTKRATLKTADQFIEGAPDAKSAPPSEPKERWKRGAKTQITFSVDPELLDQIDAAARRRHINRAALLSLWATEKLADEPSG